MAVAIKSGYEAPSPSDGLRVLVDRQWHLELQNKHAQISEWLPDLGPSPELSKALANQSGEAYRLRQRYFTELENPAAIAALDRLNGLLRRKRLLTLVSMAHDIEQNHAAILKDLLEGMRKPPTGTGHKRTTSNRIPNSTG